MALQVKDGWITLWSPLLIGLLLRFVSGVPTVEELYEDDAEFLEWKETTNVFVLCPPRKKQTF